MKFTQRTMAVVLCMILIAVFTPQAMAYKADTLRSGSRGNAVREMQQALISLGYLGGTADGIFGTNTENAVKKFQKASRLTADGLAGTKTLELLYKKAGVKTSSSDSKSTSSSSSSSEKTSSSSISSSSKQSSTSSSSLFGGNYETMRTGSTGSRVKTLQQTLISLGFLSGKADGIYGKLTFSAVKNYQKANGLTADGLAGKKTLASLETGGKATSSPSASSSSSSSSSSTASSTTIMAPNGSSVKLLHWVKDIKPTLKSGQTLTIYEPSSGRSWKLKVFSCGRHCDAEPWTADDTASMVKAFGGEKTWTQKAVYVKLPNGTWTIGSTHDMPHESQSIKDNDFNGHLCVHFLRDMSEAQENDPKYGVSNQETIRAFWKKLTGETITN